MSVRDDLIAARALIDTPAKWGKGDFRDCLCLADAVQSITVPKGSLESVEEVQRHAALRGALLKALPSGEYDYLYQFNDAQATTHADVMALFDRAIEAAK